MCDVQLCIGLSPRGLVENTETTIRFNFKVQVVPTSYGMINSFMFQEQKWNVPLFH